MYKYLIPLLFIFSISCQKKDDSKCSISVYEAKFNNYVDSIIVINSAREVIPIIEKHLQEYPENFVSINNLGAFKYEVYQKTPKRNRKEESEILDFFNKALFYCPSYKASLGNLVECHYDFGSYKKALQAAEKYLMFHPENSAIMTRMSDSYRELSNFDLSLKFANKGIKINSSCAFCYTLKGLSLLELGKAKEAIVELKKSEALEPSNLNNNFLGNCYKVLGEMELSLKHYELAIKLDSTRIIPYLAIADLYKRKGNLRKTCKYYNLAFDKEFSKKNKRVKSEIKKERIKYENICLY